MNSEIFVQFCGNTFMKWTTAHLGTRNKIMLFGTSSKYFKSHRGHKSIFQYGMTIPVTGSGRYPFSFHLNQDFLPWTCATPTGRTHYYVESHLEQDYCYVACKKEVKILTPIDPRNDIVNEPITDVKYINNACCNWCGCWLDKMLVMELTATSKVVMAGDKIGYAVEIENCSGREVIEVILRLVTVVKLTANDGFVDEQDKMWEDAAVRIQVNIVSKSPNKYKYEGTINTSPRTPPNQKYGGFLEVFNVLQAEAVLSGNSSKGVKKNVVRVPIYMGNLADRDDYFGENYSVWGMKRDSSGSSSENGNYSKRGSNHSKNYHHHKSTASHIIRRSSNKVQNHHNR